ncbi:MAG: hypothetical protein OXI07_09025 [Gammaproteobacteria bacterium]|nr:hypothetical protein [Gammaproteobacteria bacterium]
MAVFPFRRRKEEPTEDRNYSDIVTRALVDAATENLSDAYVSALEIAAGQLSRAFASATVSGSGAAAFGPWVMTQIGRQLVEGGEAVWYRIGQRLFRADNYERLPSGAYQLSLPGGVRMEPPGRVFHARWNVDTASERGMGPLAAARTLRVLMQRIESSLATENNAAVGYLLPVPADGDDTTIDKLKADLAALNGRVAVIETARGGWGDGTSAAPRRDFELARMGPNIPDGNVRLFVAARESVLAACGYPVQLAQQADGTSQREAWRRYLHGTVAPLGRLVSSEAARVGLAIDIDWDRLFASDIQGRARAFQALVGGGMDITQAAAASGLLQPEE